MLQVTIHYTSIRFILSKCDSGSTEIEPINRKLPFDFVRKIKVKPYSRKKSTSQIRLTFVSKIKFQWFLLYTVDGSWTEWSEWNNCTDVCGGGIKSRNRTCSDPEPQFGGMDCIGNNTESKLCNEHYCPGEINKIKII